MAKLCISYFVLDVAKLSSGPQSEPNYSSRLSGGCIVFGCFALVSAGARDPEQFIKRQIQPTGKI